MARAVENWLLKIGLVLRSEDKNERFVLCSTSWEVKQLLDSELFSQVQVCNDPLVSSRVIFKPKTHKEGPVVYSHTP